MAISKQEALASIDREKELICKASDEVWENPETAFQEYRSTEILCDLLEKEGFHVKRTWPVLRRHFPVHTATESR